MRRNQGIKESNAEDTVRLLFILPVLIKRLPTFAVFRRCAVLSVHYSLTKQPAAVNIQIIKNFKIGE
jgi:hypothetical protein